MAVGMRHTVFTSPSRGASDDMLCAVMSIAKGPSWGGNRIRNALMLTAVIELVLGGGFLVGGFLGDSFGLMLTGAILGGVGLLLRRDDPNLFFVDWDQVPTV